MELYSARICPFAHRTRLVLLEKAVEFEHVEIDLGDKPQRFLDVSPYGKVPAIVHNGEALYESAIINEYLDEVFPEPALMPQDPLARARMRIWIDYCDNRFLSDYYALMRNQNRADHATLLEKTCAHLDIIENDGMAKLGGDGPFWMGDHLTLLDLAYFPFFERLPAWSHYRGLELGSDHPRLSRWLDAMWQRPAVQKIANDGDYYIAHYEGYAKRVLAA